MFNTTSRSLAGFLVTIVFFCAISSVFSATKVLRVRSSPDIPVTEFSCAGRPPGYYADVEAGCQVYHMCTEGSQFSYRCPNTTLFQQRMLICAHWYQVNCSKSDLYFGANLLIGQRDKPFVDEDPFNTRGIVKEVKTLQNPDVLQNLGQPSREAKSFRQGKSQSGSNNAPTNRVFQNNFKRDGGAETANQNSQFTFSTTVAPFNNRRTPEDLSSLPIAGSVLPGGLRNFQFSQTTQRGSPFNKPTVSSTSAPFQANTFRAQSANPASFSRQSVNPVSFASPTPPNFVNNAASFGTTRSPVSFTQKFSQENFNRLQPSGFQKPTTTNAFTSKFSATTPSFPTSVPTEAPEQELVGGGLSEIDNIIKAEIEQPLNGQLPNDRFNTFLKRFNPNEEPPRPTTQAPITRFAPQVSTPKRNFAPSQQDLSVASQENFVSSRRSTTSAPEDEDEEEEFGGGLPHVDNIIKAEIDQPLNGSLPVDTFNTFIKRFNPSENPPKPTTDAENSEEPQQEVQSFINRFVPGDSLLVTGYNLEEQPGEPQFINRFVLTPEELMQDKNKHDIERLHSLQPPEAQITVNFPNFELSPPLDDSDDSESNQIQLHLQDPRTAFFIPSGNAGSDFSKADAAPIIVTIPLHSNQQNIPMLFRKETSEEPCARCHPSFIVNKQNCVPCVVIR